MVKKIGFVLLSLMLSSASWAITGEQFLNKCDKVYQSKGNETAQKAVNRALDAGSCTGYIGGVINGVNLIGNMLGQQKAITKNFVCLPQGKQAQELLTEAIEYLKKNPKLQKAPAQVSVYNVMSTKYPCKEFSNANKGESKK